MMAWNTLFSTYYILVYGRSSQSLVSIPRTRHHAPAHPCPIHANMLGPPDRPLPSSRLRRRSLQPAQRQLGKRVDEQGDVTPSDGQMGGLRERDEAELPLATRGELEAALRLEWSERDAVRARP